ncbi:SGNH/GDSL hydrolase family protein [Paenibacillus sp. VMFN-D1]|uniref:SGNH/GDSL hydrolase family protein n=1 Tax=Paenibacillus sp. VMFN-D1 TaxID=2135608 RepID=UPI000E26AC1D|nr:SGNH/GDSL hydrolase family protein [Paenibacillus sp. VMFN-D1]RED40578.1 GDSL-like lipase/acylhydrolase family protein [Paenibacillus sp. VMFN-D1]
MKQLPLTDEWFHGAVSLEQREDGIKPWRIPYKDYNLYPPEGLEGKAEICAGVRLRLRTDSAEVAVSFTPLADAAAMDCLVCGELFRTLSLPAGASEALFCGFPGGVKDLEIWLPQNIGMTVIGLRIGAQAVGVPLPDTRPRWITYGSSITQCVGASSPSRAWPAIAAEACGYSLTNLGFSGNCHMEPMIGRLIRDLPADFISICAGVNIYGAGTLSPRMFKPLLIGMLETIREKHRETPLLVISPIYGTVRETELNMQGLTLPMIREAIHETVELLRERGDRQLYYQDGQNWLGPEDEAFLTDGLHPDAEGYELLGRRFRDLHEFAFRDVHRFADNELL